MQFKVGRGRSRDSLHTICVYGLSAINLILCTAFTTSAEQTTNLIDSLEHKLQSDLSVHERSTILLRLAAHYTQTNIGKSIAYDQDALLLSQETENTRDQARAYLIIGFGLDLQGQTNEKERYVRKALAVDRSTKTKANAIIFWSIYIDKNIDSCLHYFTKYYQLVVTESMDYLPLACQQMANAHSAHGDYSQ